jgi:hypothetical protein
MEIYRFNESVFYVRFDCDVNMKKEHIKKSFKNVKTYFTGMPLNYLGNKNFVFKYLSNCD